MARTTRSKAAGASTAEASNSISKTSTSQSKYALSPESANPPKIFILPKKATKEARVVSLLNPRYSKPTRYLVCPETGIYEFTRIVAPMSTPRSWLIERRNGTGDVLQEKKEQKKSADGAEFSTYITKGADLYVSTPIDPLFLKSSQKRALFVPADDHFDRIQQAAPDLHLWEVLRWGGGRVRALLEARMAAVCETAQAGDERMFRFSEEKLLAEVLGKARRMVLPSSLEEKFVTRVLEAPVLGVKRENTATTTTAVKSDSQPETPTETEAPASSSVPESGTSTPRIESAESQSSISSTETSASLVSEASTAATSVAGTVITEEETATITTAELAPAMQASDEVVRLQRLRTAFNFICSSYVPPSQAAVLKARLQSQSQPQAESQSQQEKKAANTTTTPTTTTTGVDFTPLETYLSEIARLRAEAAAARSAGDYSRKRVLDDEELAERAEKKRRKEEDETKKKAGESRGVRDLKKVNTQGMRKMSDFFKKKA
ncbi:Uu.00g124360.m01.CDS01 [Anthostomella pinea]|uniref:Ribonuclease H2 subunit B n=1 Tax=Anthostomella pinea TaxID=933095 RepID=A0AAI8YHQ7_9PEZI|nr:Uu.00g124360.m01.CDS01 [Anthostomella pinea]